MCSPSKVLVALAVTFILSPTTSRAKTVVMFPGPSKSYFIYHANIGQALVDLGHDVWICIPDYLADKGLIKYKDIKTIVYGKGLGDIEDNMLEASNIIAKFWAGFDTGFGDLLTITRLFRRFTRVILCDQSFEETIVNLKPDLFILDAFMFTRELLVIPYKHELPFALIGTLHELDLARVPYSPAVEPYMTQKGTNRMNFFQRVEATILASISKIHDPFSDNSAVTTFAPEKPYKSLNDIALQAEIFISESDHILDYPRPELPNTKRIGGSSVSEAKPLTGDFQTLDNSVNGLVVVSFGSLDLKCPTHILTKMVAAFEKLDLNVVWKANLTSPKPDKIMIKHWLPQNDLLGHPKTKVFVSHCGKNGQYEALYHAVPILCLPVLGDQHYNSERIIVKGFGLGADIRTITAEEFADLIKEVAYNPKYKTNIQRASTLFKELYKVPMKEAAYWFDHVMKYGGDYMRSSGQEMPLYQFLLLDVMAFFIGVLFATLLLLFFVARFCYRRIRRFKIKAD
ncbi:unnamed protein product [Lymnaea stagnalis]|uniref:UDP-glucuronosyltransferase n=1 Tax=Lymnaea stagnalis TaxID=6523 RepID=A0AAV2IEA9_LYMST